MADDTAPDDLQLGTPAYGGNGCPAGSAAIALSPDYKELSILFDNFVAQAGGNTGLTLDRRSCNVAIPVHVPHGWSVSVFDIDYRGFTDIPAGASAGFNVEYFFAGQMGPRSTRTFYGPVSTDYMISNSLMANAIVWSACGVDVVLRSNASMTARTNFRREQTMATVDSIDIKAGIKYRFAWKKCWQ